MGVSQIILKVGQTKIISAQISNSTRKIKSVGQ